MASLNRQNWEGGTRKCEEKIERAQRVLLKSWIQEPVCHFMQRSRSTAAAQVHFNNGESRNTAPKNSSTARMNIGTTTLIKCYAHTFVVLFLLGIWAQQAGPGHKVEPFQRQHNRLRVGGLHREVVVHPRRGAARRPHGVPRRAARPQVRMRTAQRRRKRSL